jgi:hypothetical protein
MERIDAAENAHALLKAVYQNPEVPLPVRMRAAIACLPFEVPKLAVTAMVTEQDFATLLDRRIKRYEAMNNGNLIEQKIINQPQIDTSKPLPRLADRRFRRM